MQDKEQATAPQPDTVYAELPEMPPTDDRKLYNEHEPDGYLESDNDWIDRNLEAVRWFIDNHAALRASHGQAPAQDTDEYLDLLAQCRNAFPIPERGDPLEVHWAAAMADPGEVPGYLQEIAARHAAKEIK